MNGRDLAAAADAEKTTEALLRDARSAQRRVDKLVAAALAVDAHQLAKDAQHTMGQQVDHLMRAKQRRHREVQAALRRVR